MSRRREFEEDISRDCHHEEITPSAHYSAVPGYGD